MRIRSWHFFASGALGGLVGFGLLEAFGLGGAGAGGRWELVADAAFYFAGFGLAVGAALGMTEGLLTKSVFRTLYGAVIGLLLGALGGLGGGAAGQLLYGLVPHKQVIASRSDLAFAIDSSGSMGGALVFGNDPRGSRRKAAKQLIDQLSPSDRVAVIDFDGEAKLLLGLTELTDETARQTAKNAIDQIDSSGGTHLSAGLDTALAELEQHGRPDRPRSLIFLTDGAGDFDPASLERARASGTTIYTVGLGSEVDTDLLTRIAQATGGRYFPVSQADELVAIFEHILTEHLRVMGSASPAASNEPNSWSWLLFVLRILGWAVVGLLIGLGQGVRENTREDLLACSLGGLLGGAVGGALFDPLSFFVWGGSAGVLSRGLADVVVGAAIGGSMRLLQEKIANPAHAENQTVLIAALPRKEGLRRIPEASTPQPSRASGSTAPEPPRVPLATAVAAHPRSPPPPLPEVTPRPTLAEILAGHPSPEAGAAAARRAGFTLSEIARELGLPLPAVKRMIDNQGGRN